MLPWRFSSPMNRYRLFWLRCITRLCRFRRERGDPSYQHLLCRKYLAVAYPTPSAYKAIHALLNIVQDFAENEDTLPLNVAMELRFTKHSNSLLSPGYGKEVRLTFPMCSLVDGCLFVTG